ncbi:3-deoxy-D-manno-octulosonic acid transferase [Chryseobacterium nematophagum]|uniref:3-deoxy-D-manno-octulosonic acid transferase n=1 Tax=Chryseobacterium nematophagum TaxID=2305228 RepID=A0A3M7L992_9FLAO|nr:glycosyltransferase N-terminal domain-containing protein [Chryseobacterium nematophagum]RMZ58112.1 3-deoxy-D-manno-octulosonic acid transferase [Chryseobacterium nematophagum]
MSIFYNIFIHVLIVGLKLLGLFNNKAKKGVEGRRKSLESVKSVFSKEDLVIWMHAASLGEYEQGLPVLQRLKEQFPDHKILITFFSPSGYENVINKKHLADVICYLPFDKKSLVREFVSEFNTKLFFTVKYDYWYNLLHELKSNGVKVYVISALFYEKQVFFRFYGKWFVSQLQKNVDWFFHQTEISCMLAKRIGLNNSSFTGDTRFDRVKQLRERDNHVNFIKEFIGDNMTVVFGSSWQAEEKIAVQITEKNNEIKIIIAPHDLKRVSHIKQLFPHALLYSEINTSQFPVSNAQILIIDSIGILSKLYSYADIAVVGGGFHDAGLHNILEAATFGIPVIFGNHYKKNPEADDLIRVEGGKSFKDDESAAVFLLFILKDNKTLQYMSQNAQRFVDEKPNATELIVKKILF